MSAIGVFGMIKLTFKVLDFKFEQSKLATRLNAIVKTNKGSVKGVRRHTVWGDEYLSFERVPFAKPPLDELRFRAPVPPEPWSGVLDCTTPADKPLQPNMFFVKYRGNEDCLYLNIYTKNITPDTPRPVMVWIFGGGFQIGEASRDMYSPDFFLSKDVVLVTISYRLGALGFLSLDDPAVNIPGNAGIKDQILGLRWVQQNIAAFGGDPNNVTLFGESAGGAATHLCMLSEQSRGLIHKAIVMSGSALCPWAVGPKRDYGYRLAKSLGYNGDEKDSEVYKFLLQAKGTDLIKGTTTVLSKEEKHVRTMFAFGPVREPYATPDCVLLGDPHDLMQTTWSNSIPLMIGGTSNEGLLFYTEVTRRPATLHAVKNCSNLIPADLNLATDSSEVEQYGLQLKKCFFGDTECSPLTKLHFLDLETYREFWHPMYRTVMSRLRNDSAPTYIYRFNFDSRDGNVMRNLICGRDVRGSCHGDELMYMFHNMIGHRPQKNSPEYHITRLMIDVWTSFASKSDPNCELLDTVRFEPASMSAPNLKCLNIADKVEFIDLPHREKFDVFSNMYTLGKL